MKLLKISPLLALTTMLLTACMDSDTLTDTTQKTKTTTETTIKTEPKNQTEVTVTEVTDPSLPTYKVAIMDASVEPYIYPDENGNLTGLHLDLLHAVAKAEGFNIDLVKRNWDSEFKYLYKDDVDVVVANVTYYDERESLIDFVQPYRNSTVDLIVKDELKDKSFEEIISDKSLTYSTIEGTSWHKTALKLGIDASKIIDTDSPFNSLQNVIQGKTDVAIGDGGNMRYYKQQYPQINIISNPKVASRESWAVKDGDVKMADIINSGVEKIKANGEFDKINEKWFGKAD